MRDDSNVTELPADKGNAAGLLDTEHYMSKMCVLLTDNTYGLLDNYPTDIVKKIHFLIKEAGLPKEIERSVIVQNARPPRLHGRPTIHKEGVC